MGIHHGIVDVMDTHERAAGPNRTRTHEMMLRLNGEEREALDRVARSREESRSETIRGLILDAASRLERSSDRQRKGAKR